MNQSLLVRPQAPNAQGCVLEVTPQTAGWKYVGLAIYRLAEGRQLNLDTFTEEVCLVAVAGTMHVRVGKQHWQQLGKRSNPFEDAAPGAVYVPSGQKATITAASTLELAVCRAPGQGNHAARQIGEEKMKREVRGQATNTRYIRNILPETEPADSLLVVEVITPSGHWSSYPPHKHDRNNPPTETLLEETYYHRMKPPQGFAFQRIYTDDRQLDETLTVQDGDVVLVPRGYHPVGAAHGYQLYYLNVMAGPRREWHFHNDPQHKWMLNT